jgi:hypothetical protein
MGRALQVGNDKNSSIYCFIIYLLSQTRITNSKKATTKKLFNNYYNCHLIPEMPRDQQAWSSLSIFSLIYTKILKEKSLFPVIQRIKTLAPSRKILCSPPSQCTSEQENVILGRSHKIFKTSNVITLLCWSTCLKIKNLAFSDIGVLRLNPWSSAVLPPGIIRVAFSEVSEMHSANQSWIIHCFCPWELCGMLWTCGKHTKYTRDLPFSFG